VKFCQFVASLYPHTVTNYGRFVLIFNKIVLIFTALHGMRSTDENSVRPSVRLSVRPSVTRVNCDKTVERSVQIYIPHERTFSLVF